MSPLSSFYLASLHGIVNINASLFQTSIKIKVIYGWIILNLINKLSEYNNIKESTKLLFPLDKLRLQIL